MTSRLTIIRTVWSAILEYEAPELSIPAKQAFITYRDFNSQFNHGYTGGGPITLTRAILLTLHETSNDDFKGLTKSLGGYEIIRKIVQEDWVYDGPEQFPTVTSYVIEVTDEMKDLFPFLQGKG